MYWERMKPQEKVELTFEPLEIETEPAFDEACGDKRISRLWFVAEELAGSWRRRTLETRGTEEKRGWGRVYPEKMGWEEFSLIYMEAAVAFMALAGGLKGVDTPETIREKLDTAQAAWLLSPVPEDDPDRLLERERLVREIVNADERHLYLQSHKNRQGEHGYQFGRDLGRRSCALLRGRSLEGVDPMSLQSGPIGVGFFELPSGARLVNYLMHSMCEWLSDMVPANKKPPYLVDEMVDTLVLLVLQNPEMFKLLYRYNRGPESLQSEYFFSDSPNQGLKNQADTLLRTCGLEGQYRDHPEELEKFVSLHGFSDPLYAMDVAEVFDGSLAGTVPICGARSAKIVRLRSKFGPFPTLGERNMEKVEVPKVGGRAQETAVDLATIHSGRRLLDFSPRVTMIECPIDVEGADFEVIIPLRGAGEVRKRVMGTDDVVRIPPAAAIDVEFDLSALQVSSSGGQPTIEFRGQPLPIDDRGEFAIPVADGQVLRGVVAMKGEVPVLIQTHLAPGADLDVLILEV